MDTALKTVAYLRVSTRSQDLANQKLAILFSCAPKYVYASKRGDIGAYAIIYGEEMAEDVVALAETARILRLRRMLFRWPLSSQTCLGSCGSGRECASIGGDLFFKQNSQ